MGDKQDGCVVPAKGPASSDGSVQKTTTASETLYKKEEYKIMATVSKPAPDFEASAYADGVFKNVKLSDYKGKWVVLCFYPGDFTFV